MNLYSRYLPWLVAVLGAMYFIMTMVPPVDPQDGFHVQEFGKVPVVDHGRVKPIDTLARTSLMVISGRQTFPDETGNEQPAIKWLLDVMSSDRDYRQQGLHGQGRRTRDRGRDEARAGFSLRRGGFPPGDLQAARRYRRPCG